MTFFIIILLLYIESGFPKWKLHISLSCVDFAASEIAVSVL